MAVKISATDLNSSLIEHDGLTPGSSSGQTSKEVLNDQNVNELELNVESNLRVIAEKTSNRETTRAALMAATKSLVMERGREKISIQEITHQAQVVSGTFYNYFENKNTIFEAVAEEMLADFLRELDEVRASLKDPAMIVAVTLNHCFKRSQKDQTWNNFLSAVCLEDKYELRQAANQCFEDIQRGVSAGRFKVENIPFTQNLILAMVRHINREIRLGNLHQDSIEDATRAILKMLGISDVIARALTQRPRPPAAAPKRTPEHISEDAPSDMLRPSSQKSRIIS